MSFGGGSRTLSGQDSRILSLTVSQSTYGSTIARIFGKCRVSCNLICFTDFASHEHVQNSSAGGGKGGGGASSATVSYTYSATFVFALGAGTISDVPTVWQDKSTYTLASKGFELHSGALGQAPWSYMQSMHPDLAYGYSGISYIAAANYDLGDSASTPQLSCEVVGDYSTTTDGDAEPADIFASIITDPVEGLALSSTTLADLSNYRLWCQQNGYTLSMLADTQQEARQYLQEVLDATLSVAVVSQGKIKLVPLGDQPVGSWQPNATPVFDITDDDLLGELKITRKQPRDCQNIVSVEYAPRSNSYNNKSVPVPDPTYVNQFGPNQKSMSLHSIKRDDMAKAVAAAWLSKGLYIRATCVLKVDERFIALEPMDLITLTFAPLGISKWVLRINEINETENGDLELKCEEWPFGVAQPTALSVQAASGYVPNYNVEPGNANTPVILEPPISLAGSAQIWLATSGGSNWGGANVWISLDDATYSQIGRITQPCRHGIITAAYPLSSDPDTSDTLAVDISVSSGQLVAVTQAVRDLYQSLCWVGNASGGELVAYQGATLTGVGKYNLTACRRGAYGSHITAHDVGSQFVRLDGKPYQYAYDPSLVGKTVYIKLQSYNRFGANLQDLAECPAIAYVVKGAPLGSVANLVLESPFTGLTLAARWDAYPGASYYNISIYYNGVVRKQITTTDTRLQVTISQLVAWGVGRTVELRVVAVSTTGQSTDPAILIATKAQLAAPTVAVQDTSQSMIVTASASSDPSYKATRICISQTSGFDPAGATPYYDGPQTAYPSGTIAKGNWYIRVAQYDQFGPDSLNWTTEIVLAVTERATGIQHVANAAAIIGTPGDEFPPGGEACLAVYDDLTQKMWRWIPATGKYASSVDGADLLANSVTANKIFVATLAAISAALGSITSAIVELIGAGWNYIRTSGKWHDDNVNGWILAANGSTGDYFQEFRASSGSALVLERKGLLNGAYSYYTYVKDGAGVERLILDPASLRFLFKGTIYADDGYFAGEVRGAHGTFGDVSAGWLHNPSGTAIINLNAGSSDPLMYFGGQWRIFSDGRTYFNNTLSDIWFSFGEGDWPVTTYTAPDDECRIVDTGIRLSTDDVAKITLVPHVSGFSGYDNPNTMWVSDSNPGPYARLWFSCETFTQCISAGTWAVFVRVRPGSDLTGTTGSLIYLRSIRVTTQYLR